MTERSGSKELSGDLSAREAAAVALGALIDNNIDAVLDTYQEVVVARQDMEKAYDKYHVWGERLAWTLNFLPDDAVIHFTLVNQARRAASARAFDALMKSPSAIDKVEDDERDTATYSLRKAGLVFEVKPSDPPGSYDQLVITAPSKARRTTNRPNPSVSVERLLGESGNLWEVPDLTGVHISIDLPDATEPERRSEP